MSAAQQALDAAEAIDGYRAACAASELNSEARKGQKYAPASVEQVDLTRLYKQMFSIELLGGSDIVVLHSSADNGYPHTRPKSLICMPASFVSSSSDDDLAETLRHEAVHIHQRRHPEKWVAACLKEGWLPTQAQQIPQRFADRCRLNPDTIGDHQFWAWQTHYVPLPMFTREDYPTMAGVKVKWMDLRNNVVMSDPPPSFFARYGKSPSQPEHPYELLAVEAAADGIQTEQALQTKLST
jgi:hypothetical protein